MVSYVGIQPRSAWRVPRLGAYLDPEGGVRVRAWAPEHRDLELAVFEPSGEQRASLSMRKEPFGFFSIHLPNAGLELLYKIRVDAEGPFPDPWSRRQPKGVHGPSGLDPRRFSWTDSGWKGVRMEEAILYELHVGTATPEGTFESVIPKLPELRALGITVLELLPVASFPGTRNWGYDGVSLFAPSEIYGGPDGLRRLVDAAHAKGLAVVLDVVFNHLGPDGNYLRCYSPYYFTDRYETPWGEAVNFDGARSEVAREQVLRCAEMWIADYHFDGIRVDSVHAIFDESRPHIIEELGRRARAAAPGRTVLVIGEDALNRPKLVRRVDQGGLGLDAVWADDLHHSLRRAFAGDHDGYYADFRGDAAELAATLQQGWYYQGQFAPHFGHGRGAPAYGLDPWRLVHCLQNHDQVGNRALGERLGAGVSPPAYRAMSVLLLTSPYTPLLFMGQEWNASTPFLYFTDHEPGLGRLVTEGRRKEFARFASFSKTEVPDPQAESTFARSKLDWSEASRPGHSEILTLYRELLALRASHPALRNRLRGSYQLRLLAEDCFAMERSGEGTRLEVIVNLRGNLELLTKGAEQLLWSEDPHFGGSGEPALREGRVRLNGPCAVVLALPGRGATSARHRGS